MFLELAGAAVATLGAGFLQKHVGFGARNGAGARRFTVPNNAIPWVNTALATGAAFLSTGNLGTALQFGAAAAVTGTGLHQFTKGGTKVAMALARGVTSRLATRHKAFAAVDGVLGFLERVIGPGVKVSI